MRVSRFVKVESIISLFVGLIGVSCVFALMNYDRALNVDYKNYESNYNNDWHQFELGFEFLADFFQFFSLSFETFFMSVLFLIAILLFFLYRKPAIMLFALPNLILSSQGFIGTQLRYSLACIIFVIVFRKFHNSRLIYILAPITSVFHFGVILGAIFAIYQKLFFGVSNGLKSKKNVFFSLAFVLGLILLKLVIEYLLVSFGYSYYVGTKYNVGRSLAGTLYLIIALFFIVLLLVSKVKIVYPELVFLSFFVVIFSIVISDFTVISGRYYKLYLLLEPFLLYAFYKQVGRYYKGVPFWLLFLVLSLSKLSTLNLTFSLNF
ncbi:EpsG family protein [Pseudoalteromonas sp. McH1-42]|uniref:EpsG family protein n=1 Tax=Pseudoalteromonas sp. McH1-42 TaxID=2917752 RepID=UPI001EF423FC|nr:EpsG family protein [Pseudoalteromonas sp. McH1-42]MCG7562526.1 EpsG family protein [Pseudoalteromonas sp. McH1-42]